MLTSPGCPSLPVLKLPAELRNKIYTPALCPGVPSISNKLRKDKFCSVACRDKKHEIVGDALMEKKEHINASLLYLDKQVHHDATAILYEQALLSNNLASLQYFLG